LHFFTKKSIEPPLSYIMECLVLCRNDTVNKRSVTRFAVIIARLSHETFDEFHALQAKITPEIVSLKHIKNTGKDKYRFFRLP
jgi:hypothetical protein